MPTRSSKPFSKKHILLLAGLFLGIYAIPLVVIEADGIAYWYFAWEIHQILEGFPAFMGFSFLIHAPILVGVVLLLIFFLPLARIMRALLILSGVMLVLILLEWYFLVVYVIQVHYMLETQAITYGLSLFFFLVLPVILLTPLWLQLLRKSTLSAPWKWTIRATGIYLSLLGLVTVVTSFDNRFPGGYLMNWADSIGSLLVGFAITVIMVLAWTPFFIPVGSSWWTLFYRSFIAGIGCAGVGLIGVPLLMDQGLISFFNPLTNALIFFHSIVPLWVVIWVFNRSAFAEIG